jgi:hypothetical protein
MQKWMHSSHTTTVHFVRIQVLTAASTNRTLLRVASHKLTDISETYCLHQQGSHHPDDEVSKHL